MFEDVCIVWREPHIRLQCWQLQYYLSDDIDDLSWCQTVYELHLFDYFSDFVGEKYFEAFLIRGYWDVKVHWSDWCVRKFKCHIHLIFNLNSHLNSTPIQINSTPCSTIDVMFWKTSKFTKRTFFTWEFLNFIWFEAFSFKLNLSLPIFNVLFDYEYA